MTERRLPVSMRIRLRGFFHHRRTMLKYQGHGRLLEAMSPGLRGEVAQYCNKQWIEKVPWARNAGRGFQSTLALMLEPALYAQHELIPGSELNIVTRGVVLKDAKVITRGHVWGVDVILAGSEFKLSSPGRALTYVQLLSLSVHNVGVLIETYPEDAAQIKKQALWMAARKFILQYAADVKKTREQISKLVEMSEFTNPGHKGKGGLHYFRDVFKDADLDGNGTLDYEEFRCAMEDIGFEDDGSLQKLMARFDSNNSGSSDYDEFMRFFAPEIYTAEELATIESTAAAAYLQRESFLVKGGRPAHMLGLVEGLSGAKEADMIKQSNVGTQGGGNRRGSEEFENMENRMIQKIERILEAHEVGRRTIGWLGSWFGGWVDCSLLS